MEALTTDALRRMAEARGLALTDAELEGLLPLVQAARAMIDAIEIPAGSETEPASAVPYPLTAVMPARPRPR